MSVSPELAAFIRDHLRSVWALELLLFLKANPDSEWRSEQLVQALRASDSIVDKSLDALVAGGLIVCGEEGVARYAPATSDLSKLVADTQALYARKPAAVRRLIVGGAGLSAFADSFWLRRG